MNLLTLWLGKLIIVVTRLAGNSGAALPGYVIERINRRFLKQGLDKLSQGVVIVSGTNGKTTTTKMIADTLDQFGIRILTNKSGSNFVRSIISLIVDKSSWSGQLPYDMAILEQDEAFAARLIEQYQPRGVVALNIMRDQMDRFGEIDTTAKLLEKVTKSATEFVVLNQHDPRVAKLDSLAKKVFFDVANDITSEFPNDDDWHGFGDKPKTKVPELADVILTSFGDHEAKYKVAGQDITVKSKATGQHNFLNTAAALATLKTLLPEIKIEDLANKLEAIEAAFGRGEELKINNVDLRLQLIKNPGSFNQSLKIAGKKPYDEIVIIINDSDADSRDVSWLWDVDFTSLKKLNSQIITGGVRAYDMAVRLKYDEIKTASIETDLKALTNQLIAEPHKNILVYCTYTAMWKLRKELVRQGHLEFVK